MRVIVFIQEDIFFIPANIAKLCKVEEVLEIVVIDCKSSLINKTSRFYIWFGPGQFLKLSFVFAFRKIADLFDRFFKWQLLDGVGSCKSVAKRNKIPYREINNVNDEDFILHIKKLNPDLIVSYSAPQVIKEPLLSLPKHGIINVHGSYLPDFRGTLPSFWHLYEDSKETGATVHYMNQKIDDGKIIVQGKVSMAGVKTMFEVMKRTKKLGGDLIIEAINLISKGKVELKDNDTTKGRYYSWPKKEDARIFKSKGYRLI